MRLLIGIAGAAATCAVVAYAVRRRSRRSSARVNRSNGVVTTGALGLIGNTPLVRINSLSAQTGCEILAKCEFLNPGGSSKDRVALAIIREAEASGKLKPGGTIVEATAGSTGVSLALAAKACGYRCLLVAADDVSPEKLKLIRALGATLEVVKPASIANPQHPVNVARRRAAELGEGSVFADQFNNLANGRVHESSTGEEIWAQTRGAVDAFVMGAGTGGTLAGVVSYLKSRKPAVRAFLADPPGSALYNRVKHGVLYASQQQERSQRRHRYDTIIEGVGCDRVTANFANAKIDDAIRVEGERGCTSCTSFFSAPCCLNMSPRPFLGRVPAAPSFSSLPSLPQWRALPTSCTPPLFFIPLPISHTLALLPLPGCRYGEHPHGAASFGRRRFLRGCVLRHALLCRGRGRAEARAGAHDRYRALRWRPSLSRLAARATSTGCVREWHERPEVREREREQPAGVSQVGSHEPGRVHQGMRLEATVSDISLQYMQTSACQ